MQIFLQWLKLVALELKGDDHVESLRQAVQARTSVPADDQILTYAGRLLHGHRLLSSYGVTSEATIRLSLRLCGGKGGFGSLLRGAGRAIQSGNTDACRDLSGRRVRHSNAEKKLAEWAAEARERELEKIALKHQKEQERAAALEKRAQVDTEAVRMEKQEAIAGVEAAVEAALSSLREQLPLGDRKRKDAPAGDAPAKRGRFMGMEDGSSTATSDSEIEFEDAGREAPDVQASEAPAARLPRALRIAAASTGNDRSKQEAAPRDGASSAAAAPASFTRLSTAAAEEAANVVNLPAAVAAHKEPAVAQTPADPAAEHKHVDLSAFSSAWELESLGLDVLKAELQRLGLKCGGQLEQRAARLFLLKSTPLAKLGPEHKPANK